MQGLRGFGLFAFLLQMNMGLHIGLSDFQTFQYSDSSSLAASLIYSFIVSCRYLVTVTCFSVFYFNYHCLLEFEK